MTISSTNRKAGPYAGNGSATAFPFSFKVFSAADLYLVKTDTALGADTTLALGSDYTVSLNADQNANPGGTIALTAGALSSGYSLTITSSLAYLQPTDLTNQGGFYPSVITNALDRLTIFCQQLYDAVSRSLKISVSTPDGVSTTLPPPAAGHVVGWDSAGTSLANYAINSTPGVAAADLASSAVGKGAAMVGVQDVADNFVGTNVEAALAEIALRSYCVNLERYANLVTQVGGEDRWDAAFSAALAAALASKKPIYLGCSPVVKYFSSTWNLSANDTSKDGLMIFGAGSQKSKPYWRNTSGACMEVNGVDALNLRDFQVAGDCPVGIAGGRSTVRQWGGNHYYENVVVIMPDNMAANGGIGTIGLLGIEPEESTYHNCEFWANLPVFIGPPNNISVRTFTAAGALTTTRSMTWTPTYTPILSTLLSNTIFHFSGGCRMVAWQPDSPPVVLRSASGVDLGGSFLQIRGGGTNTAKDMKKCPFAIDASNVWNLRWFGTGERGTDDTLTDVGALLLDGSIENWTVSANAGTANGATLNLVPCIYAIDATGANWRNNDIKLRLNSYAAQLPILFSSTTTAQTQFQNNRFDIGTTASLSTIPQPFLFNSSGLTIRLLGANSVTPVLLEKPGRYVHKLTVGEDLAAAAAATTIATVVLPATGSSAGAVQFTNVTLCAGNINGAANTALIAGEFDVSWTRSSATAALTVTVTRTSWGTSVKTTGANLDIAAPTITALLSGQASFQIQLASNLSGTAAAGVTTRMDADLTCTASFGVNASTATVTTQ